MTLGGRDGVTIELCREESPRADDRRLPSASDVEVAERPSVFELPSVLELTAGVTKRPED
jgi:hypothetical protein